MKSVQEPPNPLKFSALYHFIETSRLGLIQLLCESHIIKMALLPLLLNLLSQEKQHLAAVALLSTMIDNTTLMAVSPEFAIGALAPEYFGEIFKTNNDTKQQECLKKITELFKNGLIYTPVSIPQIITFLLSKHIFLLSGQDPEASEIAYNFLKLYAFTVPFTFFNFVGLQLIQTSEYSPAMAAISLSLFFNLGLSALLANFTNLKENGVLIGYGTETLVTCAITYGFLFFHPRFKSIPFGRSLLASIKQSYLPLRELRLQANSFKNVIYDFSNSFFSFRDFLKTGGAISGSILAEMLLNFIISLITGSQGTQSQALYSMVLLYYMLSEMVAVNLPIAQLTRLSKEKLQNNLPHLIKVILGGSLSCIAIGSIIPLVFAFFPQLLLTLENQDDPEIADALTWFTPYISVAAILKVINFTLLFQLRAMGNMNKSTFVYMINQMVGLLVSLVLGIGFKKETGIYGATSGLHVSSLLCVLSFIFMLNGEVKSYGRQLAATPSQSGFFANSDIETNSEQDCEEGASCGSDLEDETELKSDVSSTS